MIILLYDYIITWLYYYIIILSYYYVIIWLYYYTIILSYHYVIILLYYYIIIVVVIIIFIIIIIKIILNSIIIIDMWVFLYVSGNARLWIYNIQEPNSIKIVGTHPETTPLITCHKVDLIRCDREIPGFLKTRKSPFNNLIQRLIKSALWTSLCVSWTWLMPLLGCMLHRNLESFDVAGDPISGG